MNAILIGERATCSVIRSWQGQCLGVPHLEFALALFLQEVEDNGAFRMSGPDLSGRKTDGRTDTRRQTDRRTDGRTPTDRNTLIHFTSCLPVHLIYTVFITIFIFFTVHRIINTHIQTLLANNLNSFKIIVNAASFMYPLDQGFIMITPGDPALE